MSHECHIPLGAKNAWTVQCSRAIVELSQLGNCLHDLPQAVDEALSKPVEFPSMDQAIVPGDVVAFAVDPALPNLIETTAVIVEWFCRKGTEPSNLKIVLTGSSASLAEALQQHLAERISPDLIVEVHDPDDVEKIAYVAANEASDPIYINRTLVDADVVIPIECARGRLSLDYFGEFGIFPLLSDRATLGRFYSLSELEHEAQHQALTYWADQAGKWLGAIVGIQIVPGIANGVAAIVAGLVEPVEGEIQNRYIALTHTTEHDGHDSALAELVIASVETDEGQQSWLDVARALHAASRVVAPHGSIVLCTELDVPIGKGFSRLQSSHASRDEVARKLDKDAFDDALPAAVFNRATADYHVYLISKLRGVTVESIGVGVIESEEQLLHLVEQVQKTVLIRAAQHFMPADLSSSPIAPRE